MKKGKNLCRYLREACRKTEKIMRLCVFFIVVLQFAAFARGNAQHQIVSLDMKNVSYFELFNEIHRQTGLRFIYNTNQFEGMAKIDVFAQGEEVGKVLESLFAGTPFAVTFSQSFVFTSAALPSVFSAKPS